MNLTRRIFLPCLGLVFPILTGCHVSIPFFHMAKAEEERTLTTPHVPDSSLEVSTGLGSVDIRVDPAAKEVKVSAKVTVHADTEETAKAALPEVKVVVDRRPDKVLEVRAELPKWSSAKGASCSFLITVPGATGSKVHTGNGSIKTEGLSGKSENETGIGSITVTKQNGDLVTKTGNGSIHVSQSTGEVKANTSIGAITIKDSKGPVTAKTGNGSIDLEKCNGTVEASTSIGSVKIRQTDGQVSATTGNGSLTLEEIKGKVKARTSIGQIHLNKIDGPVDGETSNGSIHLSLAGQCREEFHLHTHIGSIKVEIPSAMGGTLEGKTGIGSISLHGDQKPEKTQGEKHTKTFILSENGPKSSAKTSNGSITFHLQ